MMPSKNILMGLFFLFDACPIVLSNSNFILRHPLVSCNEEYKPKYCGFPNVNLSVFRNVEDFDNCAPGLLPLATRNYYLSSSGFSTTYQRNFEGYKRISISRHILRDVSEIDLSTSVLGRKISAPVGLSPVALQSFANPIGEIGSARAATSFGTVMILSSEASASLEDVADAARAQARNSNTSAILWMQTYIYRNRSDTLQIVRRAERAGYSALVITVDFPVIASRSCNSNTFLLSNSRYPNVPGGGAAQPKIDTSATFRDIEYLSRNTILPIVVKGVVSGDDAVLAARAGASGILVSNHGGRQLESEQATIDSLPGVVQALEAYGPSVEVYVDGGVRSGFDVYKALARGARVAFFGRPIVWGLAVAGEQGVKTVLDILQKEFNETMALTGNPDVLGIRGGKRSLLHPYPSSMDVPRESEFKVNSFF